MNIDTPDFGDQYRRLKRLPPGSIAPMRRVAEPEDLRMVPGLYQLFPGAKPTKQQVRMAFFMPWCKEPSGGKPLARLCADKIAEGRIIQIARANSPHDLIALRRLVIHLQPALGWAEIAESIWYWGLTKKRQFVEDYFIALHSRK